MVYKPAFAGNLAIEASLAVLTIGIDATLLTRDKDLAKIPFLKTLDK